ncbi:MAG: hypothetical protein AAF721_01295 [Myxococcota bacterium]
MAALSGLACAADGDGMGSEGANCQGAKCDNAAEDPEDGPARTCESLVTDKSGKGLSASDIFGLEDPIAKAVLGADLERCPMSVADIVERLRDANCKNTKSTFVSERSQLLGVFTDYRSVTQLECGGRDVFLHYPIRATDVKEISVGEDGKPKLGDKISAERLVATLDHTFPAIMAQDENGVFNYYQSSSKIERVCAPRAALEQVDGLSEDLPKCETTEQCGDGEECMALPDEKGIVADFRFFGSSMDFVALPDRDKTIEAMANALPGPVISEADIEHSLDIERNCAVCHPGGGLTMRELESPWVHWEAGGHFSSPQTSELVDAAPDILGSKGNGLSFEGTVDSGNSAFNSARVDLAMKTIANESAGSRTITTGTLLRPLFCTDEFNILTTGGSPGNDFRSMEFRHAVLDSDISGFGDSIDASHEEFLARIEEQDWKLWGFSVGPFGGLLSALGKELPRETQGTMTFIHRATIDHDYQQKLVNAGVIDSEFVADVLSLDFTRSVYSEERCGLVSVVDQIDPSELVGADGKAAPGAPDKLREALVGALQAKGSMSAAEKDFLEDLQTDGTDPEKEVSAFMETCRARPASDLLKDYLDYVAQVRKRGAHQETSMSVSESGFLHFRFPGMNGFAMADAMAQAFVHGLRFDPATCELINHYPGDAPVVDDPEPPEVPTAAGELSCFARGCAFDAGASCQCDAACVGAGDCCDFEETKHDGPSPHCEN